MSYDRYERNARRNNNSRGALSYWVPLVLTVTVATVGIAAWIWSERNDDDEEDRPRRDDGPYPYGRNPDRSVRTGPPSYADVRPGEVAYGTTQHRPEESQSYMARMSGALRRTPSPQQFMEGASRSVAAGVAAAGAVVGSALSSIREEDKNAYRDHNLWSEEVESRRADPGPAAASGIELRSASEAGVAATPRVPVVNGKRKTVAIVVSADTNEDGQMDEDDIFVEHASILSHLPRSTDFSKIRLFVLIYAPGLKEHPLDATSKPPGSLSSSFSNIGHEQAQTPTEEVSKTLSTASNSPAFNAIYAQGLALVEKETMVLPFTTHNGHVHILRHLNPDTVYLQGYLAGPTGEVITHLQTWLRQDVVVVVGAERGSGGLADSESEAEQAPKEVEQWWQKEDRVGRGRGVVVVEATRVGDDWARRVQNRD